MRYIPVNICNCACRPVRK